MKRILAFLLILAGAAAPLFAGGARITVLNTNAAGVGFNDPTPATPVGGNTGTTVGEQRLIAFQTAANIWGLLLDSGVEIRIQASFTPLSCDATSATLGSAGPIQVVSDFTNARVGNTWYVTALANKMAGRDLIPGEPKTNADDIRANFNSNIGTANCLAGASWYYGLDNDHGNAIDLVTVLLHEFGHGLGFLTLVNLDTGSHSQARPDIFERNIFDTSTGKLWSDMTNAERAASALNARNLVWNGPAVQAAVPSTLAPGTPLMTVNSPSGISGIYPVGTASFGASLVSQGLTGQVVAAADAVEPAGNGNPAGTSTDACSALTNPAEVAARIALVDRGNCTFVTKTKNAQNAGAIGILIADNTSDSPPAGMGGTDASIVIPAVRITQSDGGKLRANLASGVSVTLRTDPSVLSGADLAGRALLFATNPVQSGSSISHWDSIAFPNLLMEPNINPDLTHNVDLTLPLLRDIGWFADSDDDTIPDGQDNCSFVPNPDQADANRNGIGDACERSFLRTPRHGTPRTTRPR